MFIPGVILVLVGYALFYTGAGNLSAGVFTGGNVQGLATSLGLDKLLTTGARDNFGPITNGPHDPNGGDFQITPTNPGGAFGGGGS